MSLHSALSEETASDALGTLMVVMTPGHRIVIANDAAEREFLSGTFLQSERNRRLTLANPDDALRLDQHLRRLSVLWRGGESFVAGAQRGVPGYECRVSRFVARNTTFAPLGPAPVVQDDLVIFIARPLRQDQSAERRMQRLHGLSEAEAAIAVALADGLDLTEIAAQRHASIHTVRNQVKSALLKAGVRRQADLVGLVEKARRGA
jgi:DNA-binding CsgD family transcriptional regulator